MAPGVASGSELSAPTGVPARRPTRCDTAEVIDSTNGKASAPGWTRERELAAGSRGHAVTLAAAQCLGAPPALAAASNPPFAFHSA